MHWERNEFFKRIRVDSRRRSLTTRQILDSSQTISNQISSLMIVALLIDDLIGFNSRLQPFRSLTF